MELTGVLSNFQVRERLEAAVAAKTKLAAEPDVVAREQQRSRHGWLRQAMLEVLMRSAKPMTPKEIHDALERVFPNQPVSYATVKAGLSEEAGKKRPRVVSCGDGRYVHKFGPNGCSAQA